MKDTAKDTATHKGEKLFEDNSKTIYQTEQKDILIQSFRDDLIFSSPLFDEPISGRGTINNRISSFISEQLNALYIPTHFIKRLNMREQMVYRVDVLPVQIRVRNWVGDDLADHLSLPAGKRLPRPITEFYYITPDGKPALINDDYMIAMGWTVPHEIEDMISLTLRANDVVMGMMAVAGMHLVDMTLAFGRYADHDNHTLQLMICEDITPDSCNLIDIATGQKLGRWRAHDVNNPMDSNAIASTYVTIAERLNIIS